MALDHDRDRKNIAAMLVQVTGARGRVLDFGCGAGRLVEELDRLGFEAYGCDVAEYLANDLKVPRDRFAQLARDHYRLPYPDAFFEAVVSTSVLEHAQNHVELMREIHRVLKPGGLSMHALPGKWYLPTEPHIYVPLVSWMWPHVPKWWLALWARLGIRNEFQKGLPAKEVTELNYNYVQTGLSYHSTREWRRISLEIFGNVEWPMDFFLSNVDGGVARLWRKIPFKRLTGTLARETRMGLMVHRKAPSS